MPTATNIASLIERCSFLQYGGLLRHVRNWDRRAARRASAASRASACVRLMSQHDLAAPFDVDLLARLDLADVDFDRRAGGLARARSARTTSRTAWRPRPRRRRRRRRSRRSGSGACPSSTSLLPSALPRHRRTRCRQSRGTRACVMRRANRGAGSQNLSIIRDLPARRKPRCDRRRNRARNQCGCECMPALAALRRARDARPRGFAPRSGYNRERSHHGDRPCCANSGSSSRRPARCASRRCSSSRRCGRTCCRALAGTREAASSLHAGDRRRPSSTPRGRAATPTRRRRRCPRSSTSTRARRCAQRSPLADDPLLRRYFPDLAERVPPQRATSLGSGVIVVARGLRAHQPPRDRGRRRHPARARRRPPDRARTCAAPIPNPTSPC